MSDIYKELSYLKLPTKSSLKRSWPQVEKDAIELSGMILNAMERCEKIIDISVIALRYCYDEKGWACILQLIKEAGHHITGQVDPCNRSGKVMLHIDGFN